MRKSGSENTFFIPVRNFSSLQFNKIPGPDVFFREKFAEKIALRKKRENFELSKMEFLLMAVV